MLGMVLYAGDGIDFDSYDTNTGSESNKDIVRVQAFMELLCERSWSICSDVI